MSEYKPEEGNHYGYYNEWVSNMQVLSEQWNINKEYTLQNTEGVSIDSCDGINIIKVDVTATYWIPKQDFNEIFDTLKR